jgi:hypothetical protein
MSRIKTIVARKEVKIQCVTDVWYLGEGEYRYYKCPYSEQLISSIEDIDKVIADSIKVIEKECYIHEKKYDDFFFTTDEHYKCHYVVINRMEKDRPDLIKTVKIFNQENKELCCLDIYEGSYKREVIFDYNMEAIVTYFTDQEKQKINDLCRNGDMEFELWYRFTDDIDPYEGPLLFRRTPNIKLMPTSRAGFDFVNALESSDNRGYEYEDDLVFWRVDQYGYNNNYGKLFKCNNGYTLGTYHYQ